VQAVAEIQVQIRLHELHPSPRQRERLTSIPGRNRHSHGSWVAWRSGCGSARSGWLRAAACSRAAAIVRNRCCFTRLARAARSPAPQRDPAVSTRAGPGTTSAPRGQQGHGRSHARPRRRRRAGERRRRLGQPDAWPEYYSRGPARTSCGRWRRPESEPVGQARPNLADPAR
jgi:hypothetical protein